MFVGVELRPPAMPDNWSLLGVRVRDPVLELSLSRLSHVDGTIPDIRARFARVLSNTDLAVYIRYRAQNLSLRQLGVSERDLIIHDVAYLEATVDSFLRRNI